MTSFVYILRFQNTDIFKVGWVPSQEWLKFEGGVISSL
jgi:hypothetical protein